MIHTLLVLFIVLCIVGVIWWGMQQIPLPPMVKTVITVILAVILLLWCLNYVSGGHVPTLR